MHRQTPANVEPIARRRLTPAEHVPRPNVNARVVAAASSKIASGANKVHCPGA